MSISDAQRKEILKRIERLEEIEDGPGAIFTGYAAAQSGFTGALTDIDIDTEKHKDAIYTHAAGSDNITIPAGVYEVSYKVDVQQDAANRSCIRAGLYVDGVLEPDTQSYVYLRLDTYGRYGTCALPKTRIEVAASAVLDLRTDGQYTTGAFGSGCNYTILAGSNIYIKRIGA